MFKCVSQEITYFVLRWSFSKEHNNKSSLVLKYIFTDFQKAKYDFAFRFLELLFKLVINGKA